MKSIFNHTTEIIAFLLLAIAANLQSCALEEVKPPAPVPKLNISTEHPKRYRSGSEGYFRAVAIEGERVPIKARLNHPSEKVLLNFSYSGEAEPSVDYEPLYQLEIPAGQLQASGFIRIIENDHFSSDPINLDIEVDLISEAAIEFGDTSYKYEILDNETLISLEATKDIDLDLAIYRNEQMIQRSSVRGARDSLVFNSDLTDGDYQIKLYLSEGSDQASFESHLIVGYGVPTETDRFNRYTIRNTYSEVVVNNHDLYIIRKEDGKLSIFRDCHYRQDWLPGNYEFTVYEGSATNIYQSEITMENDTLKVELNSALVGQTQLVGLIREDHIEFENGIGMMCGDTFWINLGFPMGSLYGPFTYYVEIEAIKL